jgi:hypothetical protein
VEYCLFMAMMMVLMSERVEKHTGATPAVFLSPIFAGTVSVYVFHVSPPPRIAIAEGSLYRRF